MKYILEDYEKSCYEIFFIHQQDNKPFNRGAMKNIGFLAMKSKYPNDYKNIIFIFNDIDTMPATKDLLNYNTKQGTVKHFYGFTHALGGIFSITGIDFEKTGGFPNFWGWGVEDNCMNDRVIQSGLKIDRTNFYNINDHNIIHIFDGTTKLMSKQEPWRYNNNADNMTDIQNLTYKIENDYIHVTNFITKFDYTKDTLYNKDIRKNINKILKEPNYSPHNINLVRMKF